MNAKNHWGGNQKKNRFFSIKTFLQSPSKYCPLDTMTCQVWFSTVFPLQLLKFGITQYRLQDWSVCSRHYGDESYRQSSARFVRTYSRRRIMFPLKFLWSWKDNLRRYLSDFFAKLLSFCDMDGRPEKASPFTLITLQVFVPWKTCALPIPGIS